MLFTCHVSWHFLTRLTYTWWSVHYFANKGYSGIVTSPLSPQHPRESGKSCCPLVMMERAEEPQEKKKRKSSSIGVLFSPLCLCLSLFLRLSLSLSLCMCPAALSSSGMHLKETICWSICLLLCFLCHCLSPIDDQPRPFPCPLSLLLPTGTLGEAGELLGVGREVVPSVVSERGESHCQTCIVVVFVHHKQLICLEQLLSSLFI